MQKDMHYCGTYAMALAAGIPKIDAEVIAYAAQFVDDSTRYDSGSHGDGGLLFGITTAHHPAQSLVRTPSDHLSGLDEQRKVWIPFHFFPGGAGDTFREKILCVKDSFLVREMLDNHLEMSEKKAYGLELIGICAHVYADTFSHYGFSGMSSPLNNIKGEFEVITPPKPEIAEYIKRKAQKFMENFLGTASGAATGTLGHAAVATWPDRPYLHWRFTFSRPRPGNGPVSNRDNKETFLEACEKLYDFFVRFAKQRYDNSVATPFSVLVPQIKNILSFEGDESLRIDCWKKSGLTEGMPEYSPLKWEHYKNPGFANLENSSLGISSHIYRFHQAAAYHRYYVLKDLLPAHGIAVY